MPRAGLSTLRRRPPLSSVEVTTVTSLWLDSRPVKRYVVFIWCPERDSNPHTRESKGFWVPRVYHSTIRAYYYGSIYFPRVPLSNVVPFYGDSFSGVWLLCFAKSHIYHSTIWANYSRFIYFLHYSTNSFPFSIFYFWPILYNHSFKSKWKQGFLEEIT